DLLLVFRRLPVPVKSSARNFHPRFYGKRRCTGLVGRGARAYRGSPAGKKHAAMQKPIAGDPFGFVPRRFLHALFLPAHIALRAIVVGSAPLGTRGILFFRAVSQLTAIVACRSSRLPGEPQSKPRD